MFHAVFIAFAILASIITCITYIFYEIQKRNAHLNLEKYNELSLEIHQIERKVSEIILSIHHIENTMYEIKQFIKHNIPLKEDKASINQEIDTTEV